MTTALPYWTLNHRFWRKPIPELAPKLHLLPKDLMVGVVAKCPPNWTHAFKFAPIFDSVILADGTIRAVVNQARFGVATGGWKIQIEAIPARIGAPKVFDITGSEDILIYGVEPSDPISREALEKEFRRAVLSYQPIW